MLALPGIGSGMKWPKKGRCFSKDNAGHGACQGPPLAASPSNLPDT